MKVIRVARAWAGCFFCFGTLHLFSAETNAPLSSATQLKTLSLDELINVTSVSKRPERLSEAASAIQVITHEEIQRSGASSIPEALRLAPNLNVAQVDSSQWAISARGFNNTIANKLLVMIDGRTVYTPLFAGVFWDVQDTMLEDIDRIEVISGPGGTVWGANAVNGVINIITRSAKDTQGALLTAGGGTDLRAFGGVRYGSRVGDNFHFRLYGKYFDRDDTVLRNGDDGTNEWWMARGGFRADWNPSNNHVLTLQGDIYEGAIEAMGAYDRRVLASPRDTTVRGGNVLGRWTYTLSEESDMALQVYYDRTHRRIPDIFAEDLNTLDADFQHRFPVGDWQSAMWGLGYRLMQSSVDNSDLLALLPSDRNQQLFSAFLQDEITLIEDRLRLTLGSKFEHNDYTGFEVLPSGRLAWTPSERHTVWAAVSRAVRSPSRIDRDLFFPSRPPFLIAGGPDFVSETLMAYELGYRVQPQEDLSVSVAAFFNDYDEIRSLRTNESGAIVFANDLAGETYGAELALTYRLKDWWRVRGGYTYLHKNLFIDSGGTDLTQGTLEGNDPNHQFVLQSMIDLPGHVAFDWTFRYVDRLPTPHVSSYCELDVRLAWKPIRSLELAVVGQNLLDSRHAEFGPAGFRQEIKRGVYGKLTWTF